MRQSPIGRRPYSSACWWPDMMREKYRPRVALTACLHPTLPNPPHQKRLSRFLLAAKPEIATRRPVQKPPVPRVNGTLIYETAIWDSADAQSRNLRSGRRENVREQIPKLTRQPDRGILRAMDRGAAGVRASVLQQLDLGSVAATNDRITNRCHLTRQRHPAVDLEWPPRTG